jgi:Fe2+ or Zn2+ uptake regulation protein
MVIWVMTKIPINFDGFKTDQSTTRCQNSYQHHCAKSTPPQQTSTPAFASLDSRLQSLGTDRGFQAAQKVIEITSLCANCQTAETASQKH